MASESPPRLLQGRVAAVLFGVFTLDGLLRFGYKFLARRISRPGVSPVPDLINELTGSWGALLLLPLILWVCYRFPLRRGVLVRHLAPHLGTMVLFSFLHTSWNWGIREFTYGLVGREFDYGDMALRFPMEFSNDVGAYWLLVILIHAVWWYRGLRDREVQAARLETRLGEARLKALRSSLRPHFLFNTLNMISSHVYEDPAGADRMIGALSRLLRRALATESAQEIPLSEEVAILRTYAEIMRERFGSRLALEIDVPEETGQLAVPPFLLQPLVENAIQHAVQLRAEGGSIRVAAGTSAGSLHLTVDDDGPGFSDLDVARSNGLGLASTRERLHTLYGDAAGLEIRPARSGGARVEVRLPARAADGVDARPEVA